MPLDDRTIVCIQAGNVNSGAFDAAGISRLLDRYTCADLVARRLGAALGLSQEKVAAIARFASVELREGEHTYVVARGLFTPVEVIGWQREC